MAIIIGEPIRVADPAALAVEVWEVKEQARIDALDEDALVERLIKAATQAAENYTGLGLVTQTWQMALSGFPSGQIVLPRRPLQGVVAIDYVDGDSIAQSVDATILGDASLYTISGVGSQRTFGSIAPAAGTNWPTGSQVEVSWSVGFGDDSTGLPDLIRHAIIVMVATWFDQRLDRPMVGQMPSETQIMLSHWRRPAFA